MANFAFRAGAAPGLNTYRFNNTRIPGTAINSWNYDDPQGGYEYLLSMLNPSISQDRTMRSLYDQMRGLFENQMALNPRDTSYNWLNWLGKQNWNRELAALSPDMRGQRPGNFIRPARWVAFS